MCGSVLSLSTGQGCKGQGRQHGACSGNQGGGPHIPDGPVGKLSLLSVYKACTELLELTMYEVETQSYTVLHMERVSVSLIWASPFILEGTKARNIRY